MHDPERLIAELLAIDPVNPTLARGGAGGLEIAEFVTRWLGRADVDVELTEVAPGRANVAARRRGVGGSALRTSAPDPKALEPTG